MFQAIFNKIVEVLKSWKNQEALEEFEFSAYVKKTIPNSDRIS